MTNLQENLSYFARNKDVDINEMESVSDCIHEVFQEMRSDSFNRLTAEQREEVYAKFGKDLFDAIDASTEGFRDDCESELAA
jgi:hypothetical protein